MNRLLLMAMGLFLLVGLLFPVELSAQLFVPVKPSPQRIKEIWSRNQEFVADVFLDANVTKISKVDWQGHLARTTPLWSMEGAFSVAWLSDSGDHFVAGYEGGNLLPQNYDKEQVMLTFFRRGKIINRVRLNQLITDFSKLEKTDSSYRWVRYSGLNTYGYLVLETIEGRGVMFDVLTGQPPQLKSEKEYGKPEWKTYQDLMRCYGLQYPPGYSLEQEKDFVGNPNGWISLKRAQDQSLL